LDPNIRTRISESGAATGDHESDDMNYIDRDVSTAQVHDRTDIENFNNRDNNDDNSKQIKRLKKNTNTGGRKDLRIHEKIQKNKTKTGDVISNQEKKVKNCNENKSKKIYNVKKNQDFLNGTLVVQ
jgi:hypothetical protein